jgi:hypothetical protein
VALKCAYILPRLSLGSFEEIIYGELTPRQYIVHLNLLENIIEAVLLAKYLLSLRSIAYYPHSRGKAAK